MLGHGTGAGRQAKVLFTAPLAICLLASLWLAATAAAGSYVVDSTGDEVDASPGSGGCETALGTCTLRAAVEEANVYSPGVNRIRFDPARFDGELADTITLGSSLPPLARTVRIEGAPEPCETDFGPSGPCAGVDGPASGPAFEIDDVPSVSISGLAITGAEIAILVGEDTYYAYATGDWIGLDLAGNPGPNGTGIRFSPDSWEGGVLSSVVVNSTGVGLDVEGAYRNRVQNSYFGVLPGEGTVPAPNGTDIEISASPVAADGRSDNLVGEALVRPGATPACDKGCNVIGGQIDLSGEKPGEEPPHGTQIAGNYVGLDGTGTGLIPHAGPRIVVGDATNTLIGGDQVNGGNRIVGGSVAVRAGAEAAELDVQGNLFGLSWDGSEVIAPQTETAVEIGIEGFAERFPRVRENTIAMESGTGIFLAPSGYYVTDNQILGGDYGIHLTGPATASGSSFSGNLLEGQAVNGVLIESGGNTVTANAVRDAGGAGVRIEAGATGNRIGGDTAGSENSIDESGGDAIEILGPKATANEVGRNQGASNAGLFIDLGGDGPGNEPNGPNDGIQPPGLEASPIDAEGTARPGALVRVFAKSSPAAGELGAFIGDAVADGSGHWELTYLLTVPPGSTVAATQTDAGATSELATDLALPPPPPPGPPHWPPPCAHGCGGGHGSGGGGGHHGGHGKHHRLVTRIVRGPKSVAADGVARFRFRSSVSGTRFQCKLDRGRFARCRSGKVYRNLRPGKHVFRVRAVRGGAVERSPARRRFLVRR